MKFRLAGIESESIVDGTGLRMAVFFQGCKHACPGCHNPQTWNMDGGRLCDVSEILDEYGKNKLLNGVTLTGGDPVYQPKAALEIAKGIHDMGGDVWLYTGYTMESLVEICRKDNDVLELVNNVDVIVDGPFIESQKDMTLRFRGSRNQRILYLSDIDKFMKDFRW